MDTGRSISCFLPFLYPSFSSFSWITSWCVFSSAFLSLLPHLFSLSCHSISFSLIAFSVFSNRSSISVHDLVTSLWDSSLPLLSSIFLLHSFPRWLWCELLFPSKKSSIIYIYLRQWRYRTPYFMYELSKERHRKRKTCCQVYPSLLFDCLSGWLWIWCWYQFNYSPVDVQCDDCCHDSCVYSVKRKEKCKQVHN